jgi:hypothetical protein
MMREVRESLRFSWASLLDELVKGDILQQKYGAQDN